MGLVQWSGSGVTYRLVGSCYLLNIFQIPRPDPHAQCVPNTPEKDKGSVNTGMIRLAD